jgi:ATP-dependent Clp protease ATP-binding subunit ClpC
MFERFTDRARKVMALANQEAQRFNHEYIGTEHIALGIIKDHNSMALSIFNNLKIDPREICLEVEKLIIPDPAAVIMGKLPQTLPAKKAIEYAIESARELNHNYVGTEHLLLGLLREGDGIPAQVFISLGLTVEKIKTEIIRLLAGKPEDETMSPWGEWVRSIPIDRIAAIVLRVDAHTSKDGCNIPEGEMVVRPPLSIAWATMI